MDMFNNWFAEHVMYDNADRRWGLGVYRTLKKEHIYNAKAFQLQQKRFIRYRDCYAEHLRIKKVDTDPFRFSTPSPQRFRYREGDMAFTHDYKRFFHITLTDMQYSFKYFAENIQVALAWHRHKSRVDDT